jgi:D-lactate dehydrogenase
LNVADRAGVKLYVARDIKGYCCGVPFSSKGFEEANAVAVNRTIERFWTWSDEGRLPVVIDTSPCTYGLRTSAGQLTAENKERFHKLRILDSVEFAHDYLLPKLTIRRKMRSVAVHPVCSAVKMNLAGKLDALAAACSDTVLHPQYGGCCGFAGDRGFLYPELTASATLLEANEVNQREFDGYFSSSRTCEIGMTRATGKVYRPYLHLLDYATRDR